MATPHFEDKQYDVRPGTINRGIEYEHKIVALLCARCIARNVEDMRISSNCDLVGAFDDVILHVVEQGGNSATFMIQLKHKEKPTNITEKEFVPVKKPNVKPKGDFFLEKYLKDIKELKKKIETGVRCVVANVGAFSDVRFVIFTNRDVDECDFLVRDMPLALLHTNNAEVYTFNFKKLLRLDTFFNSSYSGTNLFLYTKQLHVTAVAKEIVGEIKKIIEVVGVKLVKNAENIASDFIDYVTSWAKGDFGEHYYLTKDEVVRKLYELFLRHFEVNLSLREFTYYTCPKKLIWNEVIRDQDLVLVDADDLTLPFLLDYIGSEVRKECNQEQLDNWRDDIAEVDKSFFNRPENNKMKRQLCKVVGKRKTFNAMDVYRAMVMLKKLPLLLTIDNLEEYESILSVLPILDFKIILIKSLKQQQERLKQQQQKSLKQQQHGSLKQQQQGNSKQQQQQQQGSLQQQLQESLKQQQQERLKQQQQKSLKQQQHGSLKQQQQGSLQQQLQESLKQQQQGSLQQQLQESLKQQQQERLKQQQQKSLKQQQHGSLKQQQQGSSKQPKKIKRFGTLQDLPQESKSKILGLQESNTILGEFVNKNSCELIKCKDVIDILCGNFNIGNEFPDSPSYFVERSIAKVLIDKKIRQYSLDDIILIEENEGDSRAFKFDEIDFKNVKGEIRTVGLENITRERKQHISQSTGKNVHYFKVYDENHFEWKWSLGSIEFLEPFRIHTIHEGFNDDLDDYLNNDLNIISAPPGMGKTFLMDYLAHRACRSSWVLRINLHASNNREYYTTTNHNKSPMHLRSFYNIQLNEKNSNSVLAQAVFEELMHEKKIITIFDGFDEISYTSIDQVTKIAMTLHHDGFPLWITTRPQGEAHLQSKFNTFVLNLKPFDLSDKYVFLRRYFGGLNPALVFNTSLLDEFIQKLLEAARNNLEKRDASFTGIPLQLKMLAEVFNDNCVRYVIHNGVGAEFSEDFDLLSLYEEFINKKMNIVCDKFGWRTANLVSEFKHQQALLAFAFLHQDQCLEGSYIQEQLSNFLWQHAELLQMNGIMTVDGKGHINCVHQTFAEYLVAQFIFQNLKNPDERVGKIINSAICLGRFGTKSDNFLVEMFDHMMVKGNSLELHSLHLAIRKRDPTTINDIIRRYPHVLDERDSSGRSFLHLLALNATKFPFPYDPNYVETEQYKSDGFKDIVAAIPETALTLEKDLLGFTPLDYAVSNRSLHIAAVLCDVAPTTCTTYPFILRFNHEKLQMAYLTYSLHLHAELLYRILLPYFAMLQLYGFRGENVHTATYRFPDISATNKFESTEASVVELLQTEFGCCYSGYANGCYSNIHVAIMLGSKANVRTILNSNRTCINQTVCQCYTPLFLAARHGMVEIIDDLLLSGAKINTQNIFGQTALIWAISGLMSLKIKAPEKTQPYIDIIRKLMRSGINLKAQNVEGNMCLHELFYYHKNDAESILSEVTEKTILQLMELFIDHGVDVNIRNGDGYTPLHLAAKAMLDQCVEYLLKNGAEVNAVDFNGNSALCLVIYEGNKLIIEEGRRLIIANGPYKSIHRWINNQKETIARMLLQRGADVNHQNNIGQTAWEMALRCSETPGCKDLEVLSDYDDDLLSYGDSLPLYFNIEIMDNIFELILQFHDEYISIYGDSIWQNQNYMALLSILQPPTENCLRMSPSLLQQDDDTDMENNDGEVPVNASLLTEDVDMDRLRHRVVMALEKLRTGFTDGEVPVNESLLLKDDDTNSKGVDTNK